MLAIEYVAFRLSASGTSPFYHTLVACDAIGLSTSSIAFPSRALNLTEQQYSVIEREALAYIWTCEKWPSYLYGGSFTLRTDHLALTALLSTSGTGHCSYTTGLTASTSNI